MHTFDLYTMLFCILIELGAGLLRIMLSSSLINWSAKVMQSLHVSSFGLAAAFRRRSAA